MSPERNREYLNKRYADQRAAFIEYLGGTCVVCGTTEGLQIDHIDRKLKSFAVGRLWSVEKLSQVYQELDKCQLLCGPCHWNKSAKEFSEDRTGTFTHGTMYAWMKVKCNCDTCHQHKKDYRSAKNAARRTTDRGPNKSRVVNQEIRE
jgi:hypothetical protein